MIKTSNLNKPYKTQNDRLKEALSLSKKSYHEEFYALKDINFHIKNGEIVGIIGNISCTKKTSKN